MEEAPEAPAAAIGTAEIDATGLAAVDTDAGAIAVANVDGEYFAFNDTCTHQGCSLSGGTLDGTSVTCPCHGSTRSSSLSTDSTCDPLHNVAVVDPAQIELHKFLLEHELLASGEQLRCRALAGGVSSDIWLVDADRGRMCVKRALPKLKVAADWRAPVERPSRVGA